MCKCVVYVCMHVGMCKYGFVTGRGRLRINKIENVGKALNFLTHQKKVSTDIERVYFTVYTVRTAKAQRTAQAQRQTRLHESICL